MNEDNAQPGPEEARAATSRDLDRLRQELAKSGELFRRAFDVSPICQTISTLPEGRILEVNETFTIITGFSREEVLGRTAEEMGFYANPQSRLIAIEELMKFGRLRGLRLRLRRKDGQSATLLASMEVLKLGDVPVLLMTASDLAPGSDTALALRESEAKFRTLTEMNTSGIFIIQGEFFRYMNPAGLRLVGYSAQEIEKVRFWEVVHPDYQELVRSRGLARQDGKDVPSHYEFMIRGRDGQDHWVDFSAAPLDFLGQSAMLGTVYDITERKMAEELLRQSEERFRCLTENAPDIIFALGVDGAFTYVNPAWKTILGHEPSEMLGRYFIDFMRPQDVESGKRMFGLIRDQGQTISEVRGVLPAKDGSLRHFTLGGGPNLDAQGRVTGMVGVLNDISDRVELEAQVRHAQKMEALGTLAGGVAHEFNNLIMAVRGYSQLLGLYGGLSERSVTYLEKIDHSCERAADLTSKMLTFTRLETGDKSLVDLNQLAQGVWELLRQTTSPGIEVLFEEEVQLPVVLANASQVEQVLLNLVINARDASREGGRICLRTRLVDLDEAFAQLNPWARPGPYALAEVEDSGQGMSPKVLSRIFDPFFTTKEPGRGTGLGLSVAYSIIKAHDGYIQATSVPGQGSRFTIYLPVAREAERHALAGRQTQELPRGNRQRLLVVDDEPHLREIAREMLEGFGYRVTTACQGREALALFQEAKEQNQPYDLVIVDLAMPVMDGLTFLERLHEKNPQAKVLVTSGHGSETVSWGVDDRPPQQVLRKPYSVEQLLKVVRRTLDEGEQA